MYNLLRALPQGEGFSLIASPSYLTGIYSNTNDVLCKHHLIIKIRISFSNCAVMSIYEQDARSVVRC